MCFSLKHNTLIPTHTHTDIHNSRIQMTNKWQWWRLCLLWLEKKLFGNMLVNKVIFHSFFPFFSYFPLSGSAANSRSSTQMNSYSDSGYQEVSGYYSNLVTPRRSEGRSQSTSSAPSFSPSLAMGSRAEGQALAQVSVIFINVCFKQTGRAVPILLCHKT